MRNSRARLSTLSIATACCTYYVSLVRGIISWRIVVQPVSQSYHSCKCYCRRGISCAYAVYQVTAAFLSSVDGLQIGYSDIFESYVASCPGTTVLPADLESRLQIVIHSVLASRILFRLRSGHDRAYEMHTGLSLDSIRCQWPSNLTSSAVWE